ncbi:MAG: hypothetical protein ACI4U2_04570 [Christensenellaceae bacterium]
MEIILGIIFAIVIFYFVMVLFFKLCNLSDKVAFFFTCVAAIGLMIASFSMPWSATTEQEEIVNATMIQGFFVYMLYVTEYSCIAFDREEYVETTAYYDESADEVRSQSHLRSKNNVWSIIGFGLLIAIIALLLNYLLLSKIVNSMAHRSGDNAIGLGIIAGVILIKSTFVFVRSQVRQYRRRHPKDYY